MRWRAIATRSVGFVRWRIVFDLTSSFVGVNTFIRPAVILTPLERFRETTLVHDVMHGLTRLHDARLDLGGRGIQPQKTQICPMSADTQDFARHAAQIHVIAGTEAALTELLRDHVQN